MANWDNLKSAVSAVIKENGNGEITGAALQQTLNSIITTVGANATFAGIATPTTSPGLPDGPVFYLAAISGTYSGFNNIRVLPNELAVLLYSNNTYNKITIIAPDNSAALTLPNSRYTWYSPYKGYTLETNKNTSVLTFNDFCVYDRIYSQAYYKPGQTSLVTIPININRDLLVYIDLSDGPWDLFYDVLGAELEEPVGNYKRVTNPLKSIPILCIRQEIVTDLISLYTDAFYSKIDLFSSTIGAIKNLYPEYVHKPVLFIKYALEKTINNEVINSTSIDIRCTYNSKIRHNYYFIKGRVIRPIGVSTQPAFYIQLLSTGTPTVISLTLKTDEEGYFETLVSVPESLWQAAGASVDSEYQAFIRIYNKDAIEYSLYSYELLGADYPGLDNPYIIKPKAIDNTLEYTAALENFIQVSKKDIEFGYNESTDTLTNTFPIAAHIGFFATTKNSQSEYDGYISKIIVDVSSSGSYCIRVGLLDQYSRFVTSRKFTVILHSGHNEIDILKENIPIKKGEQIAINCVSENASSSLKYSVNSTTIKNELLYGKIDGVVSKLNTTYGGRIKLAYTVTEMLSSFITKEPIEALQEQIDKHSSSINELRYVYDNEGNPYKVVVKNGELAIRSLQYKKVLALGNSLTSHHYAPSIGYFGDLSWAMASTNKEVTTWTNYLQRILRKKQPEAVVIPKNISQWETNYMGVDLDSLFAKEKTEFYDLIILRAGENGEAGEDYAQGVERLTKFLASTFQNAEIIITDMLWHNSSKEKAFRDIANKYKYMYISFGDIADSCLLGQMLMGKDEALHPITHNGVAKHCTDVCFFDLANIIAKALSYEELAEKHMLTINTTKEYSINNIYQMYNSYVTILTYEENEPNITIHGAVSENVIDTTIINLSATDWINSPTKIPTYATVFKMPDENVLIHYV